MAQPFFTFVSYLLLKEQLSASGRARPQAAETDTELSQSPTPVFRLFSLFLTVIERFPSCFHRGKHSSCKSQRNNSVPGRGGHAVPGQSTHTGLCPRRGRAEQRPGRRCGEHCVLRGESCRASRDKAWACDVASATVCPGHPQRPSFGLRLAFACSPECYPGGVVVRVYQNYGL